MELLKNIFQITDPNLDLTSITVNGIKLGDNFESLPEAIKTKESYRGWLHINEKMSIRISTEEPSKVIEFLLKPTLLSKLKLSSKRRVEKRFGRPNAIEKQMGSTYYFYENQQIVINWNTNKDELSGIYIGDNIIQQTKYSAKDFLNKFHEFKRMTPNYSEWNSRSLQGNEPRYYRYKRLISMMRAFEIGDDLLQDFQNRRFIHKRTIEDFQPIIQDVKKYVTNTKHEEKYWEVEEERLNSVGYYVMLIQSFMRFSEEMRSLLSFNSGWLETGGVIARYSIYKTQKLLNAIDVKELEEIESLLCKLIDPKGRTFTQYELVQKYDFPNVDLHTIDMDNY